MAVIIFSCDAAMTVQGGPDWNWVRDGIVQTLVSMGISVRSALLIGIDSAASRTVLHSRFFFFCRRDQTRWETNAAKCGGLFKSPALCEPL